MRRVAISLILATLVGVLTYMALRYSAGEAEAIDAQLGEVPNVQKCITELSRPISTAASTDPNSGRLTFELCYSILHGQAELSDFRIRRLKYIQQTYDERILLWMVVALTMSGVFLAGLQLAAAYQLASLDKSTFAENSEIIIERDRVSFKSSITGLLILLISFAFFLVFVLEIYKINDPSAVPATQNSASPSMPTPINSGYGPPPAAAEMKGKKG